MTNKTSNKFIFYPIVCIFAVFALFIFTTNANASTEVRVNKDDKPIIIPNLEADFMEIARAKEGMTFTVKCGYSNNSSENYGYKKSIQVLRGNKDYNHDYWLVVNENGYKTLTPSPCTIID